MSTTKDLDLLLQRFVDEKELPGAALSVCRGEEVLYENYCGHQDIARKKPLTADTLFRIHSITKVFSSLCGMMEFERGSFQMDDPVYEFLPEYRNMKVCVRRPDGALFVEDSKVPMRMQDLFNMRVGFYAHDGSPTEHGLKEAHDKLGGSKFLCNYDQRTEIRALADVPMLFEPGTHWQYGYGINIMAVVVEVVSGKPISQYMQEKIFEPLDMKDTGFRFRPGWRERLAECVKHLPDGSVAPCDDVLGDPLDAPYREEAAYEAADCGLISSLRDVQVFAAMLANGGIWKGTRLIGRKTIDMMRQNPQTAQLMKEFHDFMPEMAGYAYGYGVRTLVDPVAAMCNGSVGEFGWCGAAGPWMMADPAERLSAIFMIQDMLPDYRYYTNPLRAAINGLL